MTGPKTPADNLKPCVSMGSAFSNPAKRGSTDPRCFKKSSTCHAPKGAAARCCFLEALGRACWSGSASSLLFFRPPSMSKPLYPIHRDIAAVIRVAEGKGAVPTLLEVEQTDEKAVSIRCKQD